MAVFYPIGSALVPVQELLEKAASGHISRVAQDLKSKRDVTLDFRSGRADRAALESVMPIPGLAAGGEVPWKSIGLNRPLTIMLNHVYTGDSPDEKDMLVSSAVKGMSTYAAAPRAVNQLSPRVPRSKDFAAVPATEQGTYLLFYSPAILETQANLTIEIAFDKFKQEVFETIGGAFANAAQIPLFLPYSGLLVAAGLIAKLIGKIGEHLVDNDPYFTDSVPIYINQPGTLIPEPGFRVIANGFTADELQKYQFEPSHGLVDGSGNRYAGSRPYLVVSLDGTEHEIYKAFTPTAASAAVLERFFRAKEGTQFVSDTLLDALKLYNDMKFRSQADQVANQLNSAGSEDEKKELQARFDSLVKSILTPELKPKPATA